MRLYGLRHSRLSMLARHFGGCGCGCVVSAVLDIVGIVIVNGVLVVPLVGFWLRSKAMIEDK